jgi:hypothetical protein
MDLYAEQQRGLIEVHRSLSDGLRALASTPSLSMERANGVGGFLLGHHHIESTVLFPGLRRHGHLRSTDVAFLDARDKEHRDLHSLCERLVAVASSSSSSSNPEEVAKIASEILLQFIPHIEEEERGLSPENLRAMISEAGLLELNRELEAMRQGYLESQQRARGTTSTP